MKVYILTEDQFNAIASCILDGDRCLDENIEVAVDVCNNLKPSAPVAWKKTIDGCEITRNAKVAVDLDFSIQLFALEQSLAFEGGRVAEREACAALVEADGRVHPKAPDAVWRKTVVKLIRARGNHGQD